MSISDEDDNISGILEYFPINNKMCSLSSDVQYARWSSCVSAPLHTKPILLHNIFLLACLFFIVGFIGSCLLCWCLAGVLLPVLLALLVLVVPAVLSALLVLLVLVRSRLFSGVFRCPPGVARFFM